MKTKTPTIRTLYGIDEQAVLTRLTALWALNEAGLGGLMHLFRSPFTGIFVGGGAVLLIALIGYLAKKPAVAIPRALLLVLIIKGMVSPHSPLPAYIAVTFQGLLGALLFSVLPSFRLAALLLGICALLEAALQKLLVLTLLFGMPLWESLDAFFDSVLQKFGVLETGSGVNSSLWIVGFYVGIYLICGILIGWLAGRLPDRVFAAAGRLELPKLTLHEDSPTSGKKRRPLWKRATFRWIILSLLAVLAIYYFVPQSRAWLQPLWLILRVFGIMAIWYFLLAPVLMRLLQRFLRKKASEYHAEVAAALDLLPAFRALARVAWEETREIPGWKRWQEFAVRIVTYALLYTPKR
ncbi:hypothetical protein [Flavilitoribacter nigricans]|uniref:Uncharacterized protein n=1 Tax=Flavilitoribacter nigricans (strain ATCC 23147 / DSM 23189 / NBRC 102662 / NCIMB 1420 / SS-2) TaxID=1122177 RepID=A0A2D0N1Q1_FLAN2|nr:hypothetical protein [Flavilitoribacter nigricans]PHN02296.1 hypothetical protein CRP01_32885 [Flavilitoribacter nigricans DSM 23189 = NBRC 102662]